MFDVDYYLTQYPDVAEVDPIRHYIDHGAAELRDPSAHFHTLFYTEAYPDVATSGMNPLAHYIKVGKTEGRWTSHKRAVQGSGLFDPSYYLENNSDVGSSGLSPIDHYTTHGWRQWRNPSAAFDLIWYAQVYLGSNWTIDPLFHYVAIGTQKGHLTRPALPISFRPSTSYRERPDKPKRICLFAGYDPDGLIDPVVVEYIADLAQYADVYYLADCHIAPQELAKLENLTKGAWAKRHGCHDFGSWSMLAQQLVGWDRIDSYDELILVNDSCFLMRPLQDVFVEMDGRDCDWWGLQATKGIATTFATQALPEAIDLDTIKSDWLGRFEQQPIYDFLVGSYFLVLRKPAFSNQCVRDALNGVVQESEKLHVIRKYEIGLTRLLISQGHDFDTFIRKVYPHQPVFTETSFSLIGQGFPLLKKYHLVENHYQLANLGDWKDRVRAAGISKCLSVYEKNLRRTGDNSKIYINQDFELLDINPPLSDDELIELDRETPKYDDWWVFTVCAYNHLFGDNVRALFEEVKSDPDIKKIILTRSKLVNVDGANVVVLPLNSREGQFYLLRARHIFLKHGVESNLGVRLSPELHCFHNLWHGIPLKRIGYASLDNQHRLKTIAEQNKLLTSVIAASQIDRNAMAAAYWPLTINDIWVTGLPRHDFILKPESLLPNDLKEQLSQLRLLLNGRKLILFAPTFRHDQQDGYYAFSPEEQNALTSLLKRNGYVMGIREHMADRARQYTSRFYGEDFLALPEALFPSVEVILREAAVVATDYSSIFIDFLLTGRPVVSFAYDYDRYANSERGLFYDLEWSFPGKVARTFDELYSALESAMNGMGDSDIAMYNHKRRLFIDYYDDQNSSRVIERVISTNKGSSNILDINGACRHSAIQDNILWVFDREHDASARYRIFNLASELDNMGWDSQIIAGDSLSIDHAAQADVLIFCGATITDQMLDLAEAFRRSGKKVVVDIADVSVDGELLKQAAFYKMNPERQPAMRLQSANLRKLIESATHLTAATPGLADLLERKGHQATYVPYSLSAATIARYSKGKPKCRNDIIRICYLADDANHSSSLQALRVIAGGIRSEIEDVEFHIVGLPYEASGWEALPEGWVYHPHLSHDAFHELLEEMDICLAPHAAGALHQGELGFFEAGLHSVPTITSPPPASGTTLMHDGNNILVARTPDEWTHAALKLAKDARFREHIGSVARDTAINNFSSYDIAEIFQKNVLNSDKIMQIKKGS
ncbi:hypothetical protein L286_23115 [Sphingobium sp. HDIP04]|nr:hypothetical protein L286_23115 [Sphingobium sp. HDIP04]